MDLGTPNFGELDTAEVLPKGSPMMRMKEAPLPAPGSADVDAAVQAIMSKPE